MWNPTDGLIKVTYDEIQEGQSILVKEFTFNGPYAAPPRYYEETAPFNKSSEGFCEYFILN